MDRGPTVSRLLRVPQPKHGFWPSLPSARSVVLVVLVVATLVMPVNYRAGADAQHAHTIFQGLIDLMVGHHHHHDSPTGTESDMTRPGVSPFASAAIPLSVLAHTATIAENTDATVPSPDAPQLLGLSIPISSLTAIQSLGLLLAALLAGASARPLWSAMPRLVAWVHGEEPPPPRPA
jgi:hypothetical protein